MLGTPEAPERAGVYGLGVATPSGSAVLRLLEDRVDPRVRMVGERLEVVLVLGAQATQEVEEPAVVLLERRADLGGLRGPEPIASPVELDLGVDQRLRGSRSRPRRGRGADLAHEEADRQSRDEREQRDERERADHAHLPPTARSATESRPASEMRTSSRSATADDS